MSERRHRRRDAAVHRHGGVLYALGTLFVAAVTLGCHQSRRVDESAVPSRTGTLRCLLRITPGLVVEIHDARSGRPIADSAIAVARSGSYVDTMRVGGIERDGSVRNRQGASERPGVYTVDVRRPGYRAWQASSVAVEQGPCHVKTVVIQAGLERDR